jgi:signal transduction histidine kinase
LITHNISGQEERYVGQQKVLIHVGRYAMATLPYRTFCAPALLLLACPDAGATGWDLPVATGVALLWVAALGTACCMLLRRCQTTEDRLQVMDSLLQSEQQRRLLTEQTLSDTRDVLSRLIQQQGCVRDDERGRIARDIHDDLGQTLLAARIDVSLLQVATSGIHPTLHGKLSQLGATLDHATRSLRAAINNLRPLALGEGLRDAMHRQVREFARLSGIPSDFAADDTAFHAIQREPELDVLLYRMLQEALSNIAKHSHASLVRVCLRCIDDNVNFEIRDNGIGMNADPAFYGCGLSGMRQRISAAGGEFLVESGPQAGTLLAVSLPLAHESVAR